MCRSALPAVRSWSGLCTCDLRDRRRRWRLMMAGRRQPGRDRRPLLRLGAVIVQLEVQGNTVSGTAPPSNVEHDTVERISSFTRAPCPS